MDRSYRAALLIGPEQIKIDSLPLPEPGPDEVLVKIHRANLCPTDLKKYFHLDEQSARLISDERPLVLGHEAAGVVTAVGQAVRGIEPGLRVAIDPMLPCGHCPYCRSGDFPLCLNLNGIGASAGSVQAAVQRLHHEGSGGAFAEYVKVPARNLYPLADELSFEAAALMEPLADVLNSIEAGAPQPGETAVVFGLGAMGLLHVRVLAAMGLETIIGIDPVAARRAKAETFGASLTLDPEQVNPVEVLRSEGNGAGPHLVFVCAGGHAQTLCTQQALQVIRKKGRILLYASSLKPADIPVDINQIHYGMIILTGTVGFYRRHAEHALRLLAEGVVDPQAIRTPSFPLERIAEAFTRHSDESVIKVGIDVTVD